ncbi:hypothetical protein MPH_13336, partial [Macrophomina phaseolina MS6]
KIRKTRVAAKVSFYVIYRLPLTQIRVLYFSR